MKTTMVTALCCVLGLAGCGSGSDTAISPFGITVPFQTSNPQTFAAGANDGPSLATAQFTAGGTGIGAVDTEPADTAGNTVTVTLNSANSLETINVTAGTAAGAGVAGATAATSSGIFEDTFAVTPSNDLSEVLNNVAAGNGPVVVFQGQTATGLVSSAYGLWAINTGGLNYNVGVFAFGNETSAADMATLKTTGAPVMGVNQTTLTYNGATIGFGSYTTGAGFSGVPFTYSGTAQVVANFATQSVTTVSMNGITTQDVNDLGAGPTLSNLTNTAAIPITGINKYSGTLAGTGSNGGAPVAISGPVNGAFYGPLALETAGTYSIAGGTFKLIGSFGAGPSHQ